MANEEEGLPGGRPADADTEAGIGRRDFLERAAWLGAAAGMAGVPAPLLARSAEGEGPSAALLPDGSQFPRWERPLNFSRTYYVDNNAANADDANPGDRDRPFRTIGRAAELLQPGERVVIASGIYRECVRPMRGGSGPDRLISYEAAPGAKVHIRGSEVLKDGWVRAELPAFPGRPDTAGPPDVAIWRHDLANALFPDAYNPFALASIMGSWGWLDPSKVDLGPYLRRRGLVFADGMPLEPMEQLRELAMPSLPPVPDFTRPVAPQSGMPPRRRGGPIMQEVGGTPTARFWADHSGTAIYVRLAAGTRMDRTIEVTTRQHAFVPAKGGLGYIRVKGLTFQHVGNAYPFPQYGMVSLAGGDHWILEDNVLEWANGLGLSIGFDGNSAGAPNPGAGIVLRGNTIRCCGVAGIGGMGTSDALIEDNLIEWCGWADAERGWEAAGAKFHRARNMLFRRNVIRHIRHGNAAWWDVDNENCRVTQNVFADIQTVSAAVHFEMTAGLNSIDNNIVWDVRNAEPGTPGQRGCAGSGIFENAASNIVVAHNLIGRCDNAGIFTTVRPDRGRPASANNQVAGNIFAACKVGMVFLDRNNKADANAFVGMGGDFQGFLDASTGLAADGDAWRHIKYSDLASWRADHGWDRNSVQTDATIAFDPDTLQLTVAALNRLPKEQTFPWIRTDLLGRPTGRERIAGPLAEASGKRSLNADPRRAS